METISNTEENIKKENHEKQKQNRLSGFFNIKAISESRSFNWIMVLVVVVLVELVLLIEY